MQFYSHNAARLANDQTAKQSHLASFLSCRHDLFLRRIGQTLNHVLALRDTHNRHTGYLPDPPLQISIVRRNQVDSLLDHTIHDTVIGIGSFVVALQALELLVSGDLQRDAVLRTEFLQFGHDAVGDDRCAGCVEGVHHGREEG
jgi:hypothetical protein